ncbi:MAG: hypothetical protein IJF07_01685 [Lachnospiraceae bacterium]|nr:hypothetical protein [Lachnospiraceae bacterium]
MDYSQNLLENNNSNETINEEEEKQQEEGTIFEKEETKVEEWYQRMNVTVNRGRVRSSSENMLANIRQVTVKYIFELLFAERRKQLTDFVEERRVTLNKISVEEEGFRRESEATFFSTIGTVRTSDGREISFRVNVNMSREFQEYYKKESQMNTVQMCDPLVINMDTDVAALSDQNFYFDIDADGKKDKIAQLAKGSGYLALDKNNDNVINDGSELFGTASGNGFVDLAEYDEDGNGWIDEGDSVWSRLKIWCKNEEGEDVLYRLADKGVGAICLQNAATDFTLKGNMGQTKGAIRSTGIFLYENGNVGTVQHVDVAKLESLA